MPNPGQTRDKRRSHYVPTALPRSIARLDIIVAAILFACSLGLYTATMAPSLTMVSLDTNELATKSALIEMAHPPGSPLYIWLGKLFTLLPFGEIATRVNWMSAFFGALTIALLYVVLARHVTKERLGAFAGTALFSVSLTFWSQSIIAELYTPSLFLLGLATLSLLEWAASHRSGHQLQARRWLLFGAGVWGLSLGIHLANILYVPGFLVFALLGWPVEHGTRMTMRTWFGSFDWRGGIGTLLIVGLTVVVPYGWQYTVIDRVPFGDSFFSGAPGWEYFQANTLDAFKHWRFAFSPYHVPDRIVVFLQFLWWNLGLVGIGLLLLGLWRMLMVRLRLFFLLIVMSTANVIFYIYYDAPDIDVFFIPAYWVFAMFIGSGVEAVLAGIRAIVPAQQRATVEEKLVKKRKFGTEFGIVAFTSRRDFADRLCILLVLALLLVGVGGAWTQNIKQNNLSGDFSVRDFHGHAFSILPRGAYLYDIGAAMGYDLLYYTRLHKVRPDLRVQAGRLRDEPRRPNWPTDGAVYSGATSWDDFLPAFIHDPFGDNHRWYIPQLQGMVKWTGNMPIGSLALYKVQPHREPPADWLVAATSSSAQPQKRLEIQFGPTLALVGIDAPAEVQSGGVWKIVRYWRSNTLFLPRLATIVGDHLAVENHVPLYKQFSDYAKVAGITEADLPGYVIREEINLVIPTFVKPGQYDVSVARVRSRFVRLSQNVASPEDLLRDEATVTSIRVTEGVAPDPFSFTASGSKR